MADVDEYEKERQENIRKNRELLLSLGLNAAPAEGSRPSSAKPPRGRKRVKQPESDEEHEAEDGPNRASSHAESEYPEATRKSGRISGLPPRIYDDKRRRQQERLAAAEAAAAAKARKRGGIGATRKSARLTGQSTQSYNEDALEALSMQRQRSPPPTLRRLRNPSPPSLDAAVVETLDGASLPRRDDRGNILFENNNRHFMPNVTPHEMIRGGIFGGTALRPYYSRIAKQDLDPQRECEEWPSEWTQDVDVDRMLFGTTYRPELNRFQVKAGQALEEWEDNGWVRAQDPRGWWQWYFRFYLGRRTTDDARQIGRWQKACGPAGRFKRSLVAKIHHAGSTWDDEEISPVVRQTLFHWAYALNEHDYHAYLP